MKENLRTPWSDTVDLITVALTKDAEGFEGFVETRHTLCCDWKDGVSQSEFYLSNKAGMRASAQVEIYQVDMFEIWPRGTPGDRFLEFDGVRYRVLRDFPASIDTQQLILAEVIR